MEITPEDTKRAQSDEDDKWKFGNDILYQLCRDYPYHKDDSVIIAKIWLIGRSYAAAVERRKQKNEALPQGDRFYEQCVVPALKNSQLDQKIDDLRHHVSMEDAIEPILELHSYLVTKLEEITHDHKRSLASSIYIFTCRHCSSFMIALLLGN